MRYTTADKRKAMTDALKNYEYEADNRYLPSSYGDEAKKNPFARAGAMGMTSTKPAKLTTLTEPTIPSIQATPSSKETTLSGGSGTSGGFSAKYRGDNFLDWYMANYGKKYDSTYGSPNFSGLNDVDGAIGQSLYNYYQLQQNADKNHSSQAEAIKGGYDSTLDKISTQYDADSKLLLDRYGSINEALDKSKSNSQQSASITFDKLKKYLPTQIKAQGLSGLGVSESTMLQAHNSYNNEMGQIESNYNTQKSSIDSNYNENKASYDSTYNNTTADINAEKERRLAELLNNYSQKQAEYKVGAGADSQGIFDAYRTNNEAKQEQLRREKEQLRQEALKKAEEDRLAAQPLVEATIEQYISQERFDDARAYAESNKGTLGENWYKAYITGMEADIKEKENSDKKINQENTDTKILEGKEYVSYNGANYQIKSQLNVNSNEINRNNDFKKQLQNAFGTSNPYDSKIPNGTTFAVKADNRGSNDFNWWDDVGAALFSPLAAGAWDSWGNLNTVYMTYYNGNWYKSDKK
ncbi:MAG: hypothetical protein RR338_00635 [Clostridia bacterium]